MELSKIISACADEMKGIGRTDIIFEDVQPLGKTLAVILAKFDGANVPTIAQIQQIIAKNVTGKSPEVRGVAPWKLSDAMCIIIGKPIEERASIKATASLNTIIPNTVYSDSNGKIWNVMKDDNGNPYLVRESPEDVVEAVNSVIYSRSGIEYRLSNYVMANVGDSILYWGNKGISTGILEDVRSDYCVVKGESIPLLAVFKRYDSKDELIDFFTKAYGSKAYAIELVK